MSTPSRMIALLTGIILAGCTTTRVEQWESVPDRTVDVAYLKPGVNFGVYRWLYPEPFEIYYPEAVGDPDRTYQAEAGGECLDGVVVQVAA